MAEAIRRLVYRIGLAETGRMLGMSASQMKRRADRMHCALWPELDMISLKRREHDEFGTRELHEAEERAVFGSAVAEAVGAVDHVARGIGLHGDIVALEARILEGGITERDRADVVALQGKLAEAHAADRKAVAALKAKLGQRAPKGRSA